ncbi:hypothetical protein N9L66_00430 [Porticoccaceae bacterium]|nr:hypothetical protein [Porticoccaceae bacterium]
MARMSIGVALLDSDSATVWACIRGDDTFCVDGLMDLPESTLWVTNQSRKDLVLCEMSECAHIAGNDYFTVSVDTILVELGLWEEDVKEQAEALANIFYRIVAFGRVLQGAPLIPKRYMLGLGQQNSSHNAQNKNHVSEMIHSLSNTGVISRSAYTDLGGKEAILFSKPRYGMASDLLSYPRPYGVLKKVSEGSLLPPSGRVEWVAEQTKCVMCEVDISSISESNMALFNLSQGGVGTFRDVQAYKRFVTASELICLDAVANVFVRDIYIADLATDKRDSSALESTREFQISYSYGLFALNLSIARSYTACVGFPCATSAWAIGSMRSRLFADGVYMSDAISSLSVKGFGYGQMVVHLKREDVASTIALGVSAGYIPFALPGFYNLKDERDFSGVPHEIQCLWASMQSPTPQLKADAGCFKRFAQNNDQELSHPRDLAIAKV